MNGCYVEFRQQKTARQGSRVRETGVEWPLQKQDVMLFQPFVINIPSYRGKT